MTARKRLEELLQERIPVLDGAMGTTLPGARTRRRPTSAANGSRDHDRDLAGDPDLLNLTRPDVVQGVHRAYLEAGAGITSTNTFTATPGRPGRVRARGRRPRAQPRGRAARPRQAADGRAGVRGRLRRAAQRHALALAAGERPGFRAVTFERSRRDTPRRSAAARRRRRLPARRDDLRHAERKAAIAAARRPRPTSRSGSRRRSSTCAGACCRARRSRRSGSRSSTREPFRVGINCSLGAEQMRPYVEELARIAHTYTSCHPNAGLPNAFGGYDEGPGRRAGCSASSPRRAG